MKHLIHLGWGGCLTAGQYVRVVRHAQTQPENPLSRSFTGWWPVDYREILRQFRSGVNDRINRHLAPVPEFQPARLERQAMRRGLRSECRWCGGALNFWTADKRSHRLFCDAGCRRSHGC